MAVFLFFSIFKLRHACIAKENIFFLQPYTRVHTYIRTNIVHHACHKYMNMDNIGASVCQIWAYYFPFFYVQIIGSGVVVVKCVLRKYAHFSFGVMENKGVRLK